MSKICYEMGIHVESCPINTTGAFMGEIRTFPKVLQNTNHANLNLFYLANLSWYKDDASFIHSEGKGFLK